MAESMHGRYFAAAVTAAVLTGVLSLFSVCGSLYLYISKQMNGFFPGNATILEGPRGLFTPASSQDSYQEVFLLCAAVAYFVWSATVVTLVIGIAKTRAKLYVPWLLWSGVMGALCVFGIFHNLAYTYTVYQYVLAEYVVMGITCAIIVPLSCFVYADFSSRNVKSNGQI